MGKTKGRFTLPGESGYEKLTLEMAEKWGADVIRDSDGTELSEEIINAGYGIYSTVCVIRGHNDWAKKNMDKLQQTFLMTDPVVATGEKLEIDLMKGFFAEQFSVNDSEDSLAYWQVFDRTTGEEVFQWSYCSGKVTIINVVPWHKYTVNFLAWRIWEEISMYNHITNNWNKEHLLQIDPYYPETREYMLKWMEKWCAEHPKTTVVRFTSMFYNFVWIWGSHERCKQRFSDWASYDFTVSVPALKDFEKKYGYALTSEDFINMGKLHPTHMPANKKKEDWMEFINRFVTDFGRQLIDIVHKHGKEAYMFYDDSWVGTEPWGENYKNFGFDGLIKCVFNGFECRLCAGVDAVKTHEIRLHPYLFPVGLGGAPTFMEGGNPTKDAKEYWKDVRRAILREPIDRIGLGGYLSLTIPFPDFQDYIEKIADEFRMIHTYHEAGKPYTLKPKIYVLTAWGKLRSWTCSGHYCGLEALDLLNIIEALSGMPFDVEFISFGDIDKDGVPADAGLIINAGYAGSAWSGGELWNGAGVVTKLTEWVYGGGAFIGVGEPSAVPGFDTFFRAAHILGVDRDTGERICHGKFGFDVEENDLVIPEAKIAPLEKIYLIGENTKVLAQSGGLPTVTENEFGYGKGIYISSFKHGDANNRVLFNLILHAARESLNQKYITDNFFTECCFYPDGRKLVVINNSSAAQTTTIETDVGKVNVKLEAFDTQVFDLL